MAPVLSRSMASASLASLPSSSPFSLQKKTHTKGLLNLSTNFYPQNRLPRNWPKCNLGKKFQRIPNTFSVRCDAAVSEQEAPEAEGEKFQYQAEGTRAEVVDYSHGKKPWELCKEKYEPHIWDIDHRWKLLQLRALSTVLVSSHQVHLSHPKTTSFPREKLERNYKIRFNPKMTTPRELSFRLSIDHIEKGCYSRRSLGMDLIGIVSI